MTGLAVEPGSGQNVISSFQLFPSYRLTSSSDWATKNPTVIAGSLEFLGLMEICGLPPSWDFSSTAKSRSFSLTKHNLVNDKIFISCNFLAKIVASYSAAWQNVIPLKEGDKVSVYISHPEPCM